MTSYRQRFPRQFSFSGLQRATEDFGDSNLLGEGGEGKVYKGIVYVDAKEVAVAVKRLKPDSPRFEEEIEMLSQLEHPNLVSLIGFCEEDGERILVYEYMCNGSLSDILYKYSTPVASLSWKQLLNICIDAARGLEFLHTGANSSKGIIHRDVKPGNILLNDKWTAKISDFGLFKIARPSQTSSLISTRLKGSDGYIAPEYVMYKQITRKIDVYAFGSVLFEVLCRKTPWQRNYSYYREEDESLALWAQQNVDPDLKGAISQECLEAFTNVVDNCLNFDPKKRPTMGDVVKELERVLELQNSKDADANDTVKTVVPYDSLVPSESNDTEVPAETKGLNAMQKVPSGTLSGGGFLVVIIHKAVELVGKHHTNPSARLLFRREERRTKRVNKNSNPRWEEEFWFSVLEPPTYDYIRVEVVSTSFSIGGLLHPKESLGYVVIYLSYVVAKNRANEYYVLTNAEMRGQIHIELQWKPSF